MNGAHLLLGNIKILLLGHNLITSVVGLDRMLALETLDISYNNIDTLSSISSIAKLPDLMNLRLIGNPFCIIGKRESRCKLFNIFKDARMKDDSQLTFRGLKNILPFIDGLQVSNQELVSLKLLTFAQMLDVENNFKTEGEINIKHVSNPKEKNVAVIDDFTQNVTRDSSGDKKRGKVSSVSLKCDPVRVLPYRLPLPAITESNVSIEEVIKYVHPVVKHGLIQTDGFDSDVDMNEADTSGSLYSSSGDDQSNSEQEDDDDQSYNEQVDNDDNCNLDGRQCDIQDDESPKELASNDNVLDDTPNVKDPIAIVNNIGSIAKGIEPIKDFERYDFATLERAADYDGPDSYSDLIVANYCER
jgi:hypothetical protein